MLDRFLDWYRASFLRRCAGVTRDELAALITHIAFYGGFPAPISASAITARTLTD
jgi:alkylhydroperoxidase/carboxymuconolactone decarboxylase family protein YurZ